MTIQFILCVCQDLFISRFSVPDIQVPLRILEQRVTLRDTLDESCLNVVFFDGGVRRIFFRAIRPLTIGFLLGLRAFRLENCVIGGDFVVRVRGPFLLVLVVFVIGVV